MLDKMLSIQNVHQLFESQNNQITIMFQHVLAN